MESNNAVVEPLHASMLLKMLTDEELRTANQEILENLLDEVTAEIARLNLEDERISRALSSGSHPRDGVGKGQLKEKLAALHQYRQQVINYWRIKEGLEKAS